MSPAGWYSTCGPASRNFDGRRGSQMSGGSTRCASRSTIGGILATSSGETSGSASCTMRVTLPGRSAQSPGQRLGQIAARPDVDGVEPEPRRRDVDLTRERFGNLLAIDSRLGECRLHAQHSARTVRLQVDARHELVTEEEREDVVAVHAVDRRDVDLDAVVESEDAPRAAALPDQRVERRQQRVRVDGGRHTRAGGEIGRVAQALDVHRYQPSVVDEVGDEHRYPGRIRVGAAIGVTTDPEVVLEITRRRDAHGARREGDELELRIVRIRYGGVEHVARDHPLGEVVELLHAAAPRDRDLTGDEKTRHRVLAVVPGPPADAVRTAPPAVREIRRGDRAARRNLFEHRVDERCVEQPQPIPAPRVRVHAPPEQRVQRRREQRRLVAEVLEELPALVRERVDRRGRVRAEPRERGEVLRAREDVDGIDLERVHAARDAPHVRESDAARRARRAETLRDEREPASFVGGELGPGPGYASNVQRPWSKTTSPFWVSVRKIASPPSTHIFTVSASPGYTGFENRPSMLLKRAGSDPQSVCSSARPVKP